MSSSLLLSWAECREGLSAADVDTIVAIVDISDACVFWIWERFSWKRMYDFVQLITAS